VPGALPCGRIKLHIDSISPRGVGSLATTGAPFRTQTEIPIPRSPIINVVAVEIRGCAGIVDSHVGILYTRHRTILKIILISKLAHSAYAGFSFGSSSFLNCDGVLAYAYCRKYPYDDYDYDYFN